METNIVEIVQQCLVNHKFDLVFFIVYNRKEVNTASLDSKGRLKNLRVCAAKVSVFTFEFLLKCFHCKCSIMSADNEPKTLLLLFVVKEQIFGKFSVLVDTIKFNVLKHSGNVRDGDVIDSL